MSLSQVEDPCEEFDETYLNTATIEELNSFIRLAGKVDQEIASELCILKAPLGKVSKEMILRRRELLLQKNLLLDNLRMAKDELKSRDNPQAGQWDRIEAKIDKILELLDD